MYAPIHEIVNENTVAVNVKIECYNTLKPASFQRTFVNQNSDIKRELKLKQKFSDVAVALQLLWVFLNTHTHTYEYIRRLYVCWRNNTLTHLYTRHIPMWYRW